MPASVQVPEPTKPLVWRCLKFKNHGQFCFSWPSIHLFATLGKQMHFGFPIGGRTAGVACPAATRQGDTYSKCDAAHTESPTQYTRCMIRTQAKHVPQKSTSTYQTSHHNQPQRVPCQLPRASPFSSPFSSKVVSVCLCVCLCVCLSVWPSLLSVSVSV